MSGRDTGVTLALSAALSVVGALAAWRDPLRRREALQAAVDDLGEALAACDAGRAGDVDLPGHQLRSMLDGITGYGVRLGPVFGGPSSP